MINFFSEITPIKLKLPKWAIKSYGGSSFFFQNKLLVTTRNLKNQSRISVYNFDIVEKTKIIYNTELKIPNLLKDINKYENKSLGQSYPVIQIINSLKILFYSDWYYDRDKKSFLNRLAVAEIDDDLVIRKFHIFKNGFFSRAGAIRIYLKQKKLNIFAPIFKDFEINFPNYEIYKFEVDLNNLKTFEDIIKNLMNADGIPIKNNISKTTCFNIIPSIKKSQIGYDVIYSARNDNELYNLYTGKLDSNMNQIFNIKKLKFNESLSYPSLFTKNNEIFMLNSKGRFGVKGLLISKILI